MWNKHPSVPPSRHINGPPLAHYSSGPWGQQSEQSGAAEGDLLGLDEGDGVPPPPAPGPSVKFDFGGLDTVAPAAAPAAPPDFTGLRVRAPRPDSASTPGSAPGPAPPTGSAAASYQHPAAADLFAKLQAQQEQLQRLRLVLDANSKLLPPSLNRDVALTLAMARAAALDNPPHAHPRSHDPGAAPLPWLRQSTASGQGYSLPPPGALGLGGPGAVKGGGGAPGTFADLDPLAKRAAAPPAAASPAVSPAASGRAALGNAPPVGTRAAGDLRLFDPLAR